MLFTFDQGNKMLKQGDTYDAVITKDRHGFERITTRILTIEYDGKDDEVGHPKMYDFVDFMKRYDINKDKDGKPTDAKYTIIKKKLNIDAIWDKMPKLYPYQNAFDLGNRIISPAKHYAASHRFLWIRDQDTIEFDDKRYAQHITETDLNKWPTLREWLADPETQYVDQESARNGLHSSKTIDMQTQLGWNNEFITTLDPDRLSDRMSIMGRLDAVPWTDAPKDLEIVYLTEADAEAIYGYVPADGIILCNAAAMKTLKYKNSKGISECISEATKIRGGYGMAPIKGTIQLISEVGDPALYVIEGGSLKIKLNGVSDKIIITREQILSDNAPFYIETPCRERKIRNPKFGSHMLSLMAGQIRNKNPELADALVPKIPKSIQVMANYEGQLIDYVYLCTFPYTGYGEQSKNDIERVLQLAIDGEITIHDMGDDTQRQDGDLYCHFGRASYQTEDMDLPLVFGLTSTGKKLIRGGVRLLNIQSVRDDLDKHIAKMIRNVLTRRIHGCGGIVQGNRMLGFNEVKVSREMAKRMISNLPEGKVTCDHLTKDGEWKYGEIELRDHALELLMQGQYPVASMYWPSKFPHCLMQMRAGISERISGASIQVNPSILDTLGGDSDGDLFYLLDDPRIVRCIPDVTEEINIIDPITKKEYSYKNMMHMTNVERDICQREIDSTSAYLAKSTDDADSYVRFARICSAAVQIGSTFIARDIMVDVSNWDLRVYIRMGQLCQEALSGLKMSSGGDVVKWYLSNKTHLAKYLGMPESSLPFEGKTPWWDMMGVLTLKDKKKKKSILRYRNMYSTMCSKVTMDKYLEHAPVAGLNKLSLFEWMLARTRVGDLHPVPVLTRGDLKREMNKLHASDDDLKRARYYLRSINVGSFDTEGRFYPDDHGEIRPMWNRWMRAEMLKNYGVPIDAIKKSIYQHLLKYPESVENLGLIDILSIQEVTIPDIISEVTPVTKRSSGDVAMDYLFDNKYDTLEDGAIANNIPLEDIQKHSKVQ